jgi:hypothetical protein
MLHTMSLLLLLLLLFNPKMPFKRTWNFVLFVSLVLILLVPNSIKYAFHFCFRYCYNLSLLVDFSLTSWKRQNLLHLCGQWCIHSSHFSFNLSFSHFWSYVWSCISILHFDLAFSFLHRSSSNLADPHVKLHLLVTQLRELKREREREREREEKRGFLKKTQKDSRASLYKRNIQQSHNNKNKTKSIIIYLKDQVSIFCQRHNFFLFLSFFLSSSSCFLQGQN